MGSSEFKQQFCSLFQINDLANEITTLVDVDDEQPSLELFNFYAHSIDLIQKFLVAQTLIFETRSSYLQSVFSRMRFVSADRIRLSYRYQENLVRRLPLSTIIDSYIDESMGKFYILKKYEQSESRHIDTMVNYLVSDQAARLNLAHYIRQLFRLYQDQDIASLERARENLPPSTTITWIIPGIMKDKPSESLDEDDNSDDGNKEPVEIPADMLEAMKNRPGWKLSKPPSQPPIESDQPKSMICFPEKAGIDITVEPTRRDSPLKSQVPIANTAKTEEKISPKDPIATNISPPVSKVSDARQQPDGPPVTIRGSDQSTEGKNSILHLGSTKIVFAAFVFVLVRDKPKSSSTSFSLANFARSSANFERIPVSTLKNFILSPIPPSNVPSPTTVTSSGNDTERIIGRRGEEFVYRYLSWKYPEKTIEWVNEKQESGQPFDIQLMDKASNKPVEFIEVKTTRSSNQNTFQISINEIECLLANQTNYHIYRVYSVDDEKSCAITVISGLKIRLQQKQLALSMTILEKSDE